MTIYRILNNLKHYIRYFIHMDFSWSLTLVEANFVASALLKFWLTSLKSCIRLWNPLKQYPYFFSSVSSQQQEHIAALLRWPRFSVGRINSYELTIYNSNRYLWQRFLRQKINSSQIKVCRFHEHLWEKNEF